VKGRAVMYLVGIGVVAGAAAAVWSLFAARGTQARAEADERSRAVAAGPRVQLAVVERSPALRQLSLQGEARPYASVTLYAKVSGYLKDVRIDKGDRVREGQLLATIESPELDRQYEAAVADARNKRVNAERATNLAKPGVVSAQEADSARAAAEVAEANVASLSTQRSYEQLRAPFAGTVTARFADPGALVQNAANAQTSALPVVTVSQIERLRVYVYLDQRDAAFVRVGDAAEIGVPERAGRPPLVGKVARLAHELDARTRMMLVEIDLDNKKGEIVPGGFVQVGLTVSVPSVLELPVEALVMRGRDPYVAVVASDGKVSYRAVKIGDDDGKRVRILDGVAAGERVALNLGDSVADGSRVQVIASRDGGAGR
jgi:RND family efflux transporter MFP subunit